MKVSPCHELPESLQPVAHRAKRLEYATLAFLAVAITLMGIVMGSSQAMKAALFEDLLALVPPLAFLLVERQRVKPPRHEYPYGFHRIGTIAYLVSAASLLAMGVFLLVDSSLGLLTTERPAVGTVEVAGRLIWQGWLMIAVLAFAGIGTAIIGHLKLAPAEQLHDKVLFADAQMGKADWQTSAAGIVGILGIGAGLWWADAAAALVIALSILADGYRNLVGAGRDLMDQAPTTVTTQGFEELPQRIVEMLEAMPWASRAVVRLREAGRVFFGEAVVEVRSGSQPLDPRTLEDASARALDLDWRLEELAIVPVEAIQLPRDWH